MWTSPRAARHASSSSTTSRVNSTSRLPASVFACSPPELAKLADAQPGLPHHGDHRPAADPAIPAPISIHLPSHCEQLIELIGLENPPLWARRPQATPLPAGGVAW